MDDTTQTRDAPFPSVTVHNTTWHQDNIATLLDINGPVLQREWRIRDEGENLFGPTLDGRGDDNCQALEMSQLDYFLIMFPSTDLQEMVCLTNKVLTAQSSEKTSCGELLKFFGILILASKFEFKSRSLWSTIAPSKYIPAPSFGRTGMPRRRLDDLWKCIRWSHQPPVRPYAMSSEQASIDGDLSMTLSTSSMRTEVRASSHLSSFVLMNQYQDGTERAATG